MDELAPLAAAVHAFWFGAPPFASRPEWFRKDPAFDATIRTRFGEAVAAACAGAYGEWCATPRGALARVLLLDQFTRNIGRDSPAAFAGDARAIATADDAIARGFDRVLEPVERQFMYLPFEHAEDPAAQDRSLALFGALARDAGRDDLLDWAQRHADVIRRFGRFPHRNAALGRTSTPDEIAFLATPGSGF